MIDDQGAAKNCDNVSRNLQMIHLPPDLAMRDTRMKLSFVYIMFIAALVMFLLGTFAGRIIERPEELRKISASKYSIITSGLKPKSRRVLHSAAFVIFVCALVLLLYAQKLDKSLSCENDVLHLRRYCRIYQYLLITAGLINVALTIFAIRGLLNVTHIEYAHIFHSRVFGNFGCLLICIWFYLITRNYIKTLRRTPPSVILAAKARA